MPLRRGCHVWHVECIIGPIMRGPARSWLNLTQFLLLVGCSSTHLPLDANGGEWGRDTLPVEPAGTGKVAGSAARGGAGAWAGTRSQTIEGFMLALEQN